MKKTVIFYLIICFIILSFIEGTQLKIDTKKAFKHVEKLVNFGPHPSGSQAIKEIQKYIINTLKRMKIEVKEYPFVVEREGKYDAPKSSAKKTALTSISASTATFKVAMKNIVGIIPGKSEKVIIIASHYDSKYFENIKFVGANDSCSSTGLLLELARIIKKRKNVLTYWITFFDGEEAFVDFSSTDGLYGSRYMISKLKEEKKLENIKALILLDMIGDKNLTLKRDTNSTSWLVDLIWKTGKELGYNKIFLDEECSVIDDHIPFISANVPAIDIIDVSIMGSGGQFDTEHQYWHTDRDTLDKIGARSLEIVGNVVLKSLDKIEKEF